MFLLCITAACNKAGNSVNGNNTNQTKEAAIKISAEYLMKEWKNDRAANDAKYAGRILEISGTAVSVDKSGDKAEIRLSGGDRDIACHTEATHGTEKLSDLIEACA